MYSRRRFVRFHAFQWLFFNIAYVIVHFGLALFSSLGWVLSSLVAFLAFILWVVMVVKAHQGQMSKLPVIGDMAEKQAGTG